MRWGDDLCRDGLTIVACRMHGWDDEKCSGGVVTCCVVSQLSDFFRLAGGSSVVFLLWACVPPRYLRPVKTQDSCFARTRNLSQASFVVPSLKYFRDSFSHTAAVKILVGPLRGSCFRQVASGTGNTVFFTFSLFSSSDDGAFLSSSGFKNLSGTFNCTRGRTAPFMTVINVVLSVILARAATFAHTSDRCWCAHACSKISVIKAISSARLVRSGNFLKNSSPDGISSGGSTTSMTLAIKCWCKYKPVRSLMVLNTTSVSAAPILSHCFVMIFLKFWTVSESAILVSWWIKIDRVLKTLLILSWYCSASATFCAPASGHSSSSSSTISTTGSALSVMTVDVLELNLRRGATWLATPKQGSNWWFWREQLLI